jgi:hypothetical protein
LCDHHAWWRSRYVRRLPFVVECIACSKWGGKGGTIYPPAYQQVLKGLPAVDYAVRDIIYRPRNVRAQPPPFPPPQAGEGRVGAFAGDLAKRRRAKFVPGESAVKVHQTKEPEHKQDFDEWLARIICYAFQA